MNDAFAVSTELFQGKGPPLPLASPGPHPPN